MPTRLFARRLTRIALMISGAAGVFAVAGVASAAILPIVVDNTSAEPSYWWSSDASQPAGAFDEFLFDGQGAHWVSPRETSPQGAVSSIFRRPDITLNNALSLAGLYGATHILIGDVAREGAEEQAWLGLPRAEVVFRGFLIEVSSGAVLDEFEVRRVSHDPDGTDLATRATVVQAQRAAEAAVQSPTEVGLLATQPVVIIRSRPGAAPFIAVRGALRDVHPGVVDVSESWATEGNIALSLILDEGVDFETVARSVSRLQGVVVEGTLVVAVSRTEYGIEIDAVPAEPGSEER